MLSLLKWGESFWAFQRIWNSLTWNRLFLPDTPPVRQWELCSIRQASCTYLGLLCTPVSVDIPLLLYMAMWGGGQAVTAF